MILLPNDEKKIVYPAIAVMNKGFSIRSLYDSYKLDVSEFVLDYEESKMEKTYVNYEKWDSFFEKGELRAFEGLKPVWDGRAYNQVVLKYVHPLRLLDIKCSYMRANLNANPNEYVMLDLFNKFEKLNIERELEVFEKAKKLIEYFDESLIDNEIFKQFIQMKWPMFGYFATEIVGNIEFVPLENAEIFTYDEINDKKGLLEYCKKFELGIEEERKKEYLRIVNAKETALHNEKVLTLARRVNTRVNSR